MLFLLLLLSFSNASYHVSLDGYECEQVNPSRCTFSNGWQSVVEDHSSFLTYTYFFSPSQYVVGSFSPKGFPSTWFNFSVHSLQPAVNVAAFPLFSMEEGMYRCNATQLLMQEPCVGQCIPTDNQCNVGTYSFLYDPDTDSVSILYKVNVLMVDRSMGTFVDGLGFILIGWNSIPILRSDVYSVIVN